MSRSGFLRLVGERLGFLVLTVWIVTTVTFLLFRLMPGDPTLAYLSPTFNEETRRALLASFGLDKPLWMQYLIYMGNLLQGDLGTSFLQRVPVSQLLGDALPNTVILTLVSLSCAYAFGIVVGAFLAFHRGGAVEAAAIPAPWPPDPPPNSGSACCCWRGWRSSSAGSPPAARSTPARR